MHKPHRMGLEQQERHQLEPSEPEGSAHTPHTTQDRSALHTCTALSLNIHPLGITHSTHGEKRSLSHTLQHSIISQDVTDCTAKKTLSAAMLHKAASQFKGQQLLQMPSALDTLKLCADIELTHHLQTRKHQASMQLQSWQPLWGPKAHATYVTWSRVNRGASLLLRTSSTACHRPQS